MTAPALTTDHLALLTVPEAAAAAGVTPATVRVWVHRAARGRIVDSDGQRLPLAATRDNMGRVVVAESELLDVEHAMRVKGLGRARNDTPTPTSPSA